MTRSNGRQPGLGTYEVGRGNSQEPLSREPPDIFTWAVGVASHRNPTPAAIGDSGVDSTLIRPAVSHPRALEFWGVHVQLHGKLQLLHPHPLSPPFHLLIAFPDLGVWLSPSLPTLQSTSGMGPHSSRRRYRPRSMTARKSAPSE